MAVRCMRQIVSAVQRERGRRVGGSDELGEYQVGIGHRTRITGPAKAGHYALRPSFLDPDQWPFATAGLL